jgi:hypothetical protein
VTRKVFLILLALVLALSVGLVACGPTGQEEEEEEEMSMDDAIELVVEEILPNIPEIEAGLGWPWRCLRLQSSLPEGTVIQEDVGYGDAANPPPPVEITLEEETFFFYLDLAPGGFYEHPVKYILVDKTGDHEELDASWWPRIDDWVPEELLPREPNPSWVVDASEFGLPEPYGSIFDRDIFESLMNREGFIVVQGLMPDEPCYECCDDDYQNRMSFFNAYATGFSEVWGLAEDEAVDVLTKIDSMVADGLDPITISIVAHGGTNTIRLGGTVFSVSQFQSKMAQYPDATFNMILTSCHSGSFIDELRTLANVCVVVTACAADESAWCDVDEQCGLNDFNPNDVGAEWTSSIVDSMAEIMSNSVWMDQMANTADDNDASTTCVLICEAYHGALGNNSPFGMTQDLDLAHRCGIETPQMYCSCSLGPAIQPDLVPIEDGYMYFCHRDEQGLYVTVQNQDFGTAPASTTRVEFKWTGGPTDHQIVDLPAPSISGKSPSNPAGGKVTVGPFPIPGSCFDPDCGFTITVDVNGDVIESDETNNSADGHCIG